ncbi:hypothetical protein FOZ63_007495, partial [Perkinsus olseni]
MNTSPSARHVTIETQRSAERFDVKSPTRLRRSLSLRRSSTDVPVSPREAVDMTLFDQHWTSRLQNRPYTRKKETGAWVGGAFLGLLALPFGPMGMVVLGAVGAGLGSLVGLVLDRRERRTGRLLASREHRRLKYLIRYASDRFPRSDDPAGFLESAAEQRRGVFLCAFYKVITEFKPVAEIGTISNTAKKELTLLYSFLCRDDVHQCLWIYTDDFLK